MRTLWILALLAPFAGTLNGITMPDTIVLDGHPLVLNGQGLREVLLVDIYVAGLYLPERTVDYRRAIQDDVSKRLELHFLRSIDADEMRESIQKAIDKNPSARSGIQPELTRLNRALDAMAVGDVIRFDYVPGQGTEIRVRNQVKDRIPGVGFMRALWTLYLGAEPPTEKLKEGLMRGSPSG